MISLLVVSLLAAAPDAGVAAPNSTSNQSPMLRELSPLTRQPVKTAQYRFEIEAVSPPEVKEGNDRAGVEVDLGTRSKMQCVVSGQFDHASTFRQTVEGLAAQREIRSVGVQRITEVGGWPVLIGELVYAPKGRKDVLEYAKIGVASGPRGGIFCFHAEPGYRETFARVMNAAFGSLQPASEKPVQMPIFTELHVVKADKQVVGFYHRSILANDKTFEVLTRRSAVSPLEGSKYLFSDEQTEQLVGADGFVAVQRYVSVVGGKLVADVTLKRNEDGTYTFSGTRSGKPVDGGFRPERPLMSEVEIALDLQQALSKPDAFTQSFEIYDPSVAVDRTDKMEFARTEGARELIVKTGGDTVKAFAAADGTIERWASIKGPKFEQQRVSTRGEWPGQQ